MGFCDGSEVTKDMEYQKAGPIRLLSGRLPGRVND